MNSNKLLIAIIIIIVVVIGAVSAVFLTGDNSDDFNSTNNTNVFFEKFTTNIMKKQLRVSTLRKNIYRR